MLLLAFGGAGFALLRAQPARECNGLPSWLPDERSAAFVAENQLKGRIVVFFNWGEFVIWHFSPELKVSTDGRRETVYSNRHIQGHLEIYRGSQDGLAYLRQLDPDYIWLPKSYENFDKLHTAGWQTVFEGDRSTVLARHDRVASITYNIPKQICFQEATSRASPIGSGFWKY